MLEIKCCSSAWIVESRGSEMPECKVVNFLKATPSSDPKYPLSLPVPLTSSTGSLQILQTNFKTVNGLSVSWKPLKHTLTCQGGAWMTQGTRSRWLLFGGWCVVPSAFYGGLFGHCCIHLLGFLLMFWVYIILLCDVVETVLKVTAIAIK